MPSASAAATSRVARTSRLLALAGALALLASLLTVAVGPSAADAQTSWTPASEATVRPGSELVGTGGQCTSNFIFTSGEDVLIGSAAHCTGSGGAQDVDGCLTASQELGSPVMVEGAEFPARLVYSSWDTMQRVGEQDPDTCLFNDFALLELDARDADRVNPSVPHWGGPVALGDGTTEGERVFSYGNSSLRGGLELLKPKTGVSLGQSGGGWTHSVYTVTPGIPGDSGSAFLDGDGGAMGVVSTLALAPLPGSNGVSDLPRALAYANQFGGFDQDVELALGTEPFSPDQLPLGGLPGLSGDGLGDLGGISGDGADDASTEPAPREEPAEETPRPLTVEITLFGRTFGF